MKEELILLQKEEHICTLTMNRPDVLNAINRDMILNFESAIDKIENDKTVRVIILTGAGKNFSSGADLKLLADATYTPDTLNILRRLRKIILRLRELSQPVIVKVKGVAYGFGANLALVGDFVVAENNARFCEVFVKINAMIDGGGIYFLPRLVGMAKARELAMLGEEISGQKAEEIGLIYKAVSEDKLDEIVLTLAKKLCSMQPTALALIKEGLDASWNMTIAEALEWECSHQAIMLQSNEHKLIIKNLMKK
jgi:enoyl-CoA hydratase/2-(1,2-epoxy-1,2-dihydrophenyl)acetyl-CoA isomerase